MLRFIWLSLLIMPCVLSFSQYDTLLIVNQDGSTEFNSIQEAINETKSFPEKKITIFIKNGTYREKVRLYQWNPNVILRGENKDSTILIFDDHFKKINKGRNSTFLTPTLSVESNNVLIENLTIKNDAGPIGQAIALSITGTNVEIRNCNIIGNQDTLYCDGTDSRQYIHDCYIEGTTDFIFGGATLYVENCTLRIKANSYVTAASTPKGQEYGFVFFNCLIKASDEVQNVHLGRPWRPYAQTVFINCDYQAPIVKKGWDLWGNEQNKKTVYYAEFSPEIEWTRPEWINRLSESDLPKFTRKNVLNHK